MNKIDWFYSRKWGIFHHYLPHSTAASSFSCWKEYESFSDRVDAFDVENYAKTMHELNVGYVLFTVMQAYRFMCAPNDTFNKITGYKPGEACSKRDLIADLIKALDKYDIPLFLYFTADGPYLDEKAGKSMGYYGEEGSDSLSREYVEKWASVMKEYAIRYGNKVHGWWLDGANENYGFTDDLLKLYKDAAKAGNPDAIISFNNGICSVDINKPEYQKWFDGVTHPWQKRKIVEEKAAMGDPIALKVFEKPIKYVLPYSIHDDFTAGEANTLEQYPESRFLNGAQWHICAFLGARETRSDLWGFNGNYGGVGCEYSSEYVYNYVKKCNELGGVVTIDTAIYDDGHIDWGQYEILKKLGELRK